MLAGLTNRAKQGRFHRYTFVIVVTDAQGVVVETFTMSGKELQARGQMRVGATTRPGSPTG